MRFGGTHISKDLLLTADVMNTLNGGMSQPSVNLSRDEDRYLLKARIPGVHPEKMQIDIKDNQLFIFHHISYEREDIEREIQSIPYNIGFINIPFDVDVNRITARYEQGALIVDMPFNELAGGYHRRVDIEH